MPARIQGAALGLGSAKQVNISTISPTFNRWRQLNSDIPYLIPGTETDKDEIGKGHEFITEVFKTAKEPGNTRIEKYGSPEFMLWAWAYALGQVPAPVSALYTIHPIDPGTTLELPYFTRVVQLAEGGGSAIDEAEIGCAIESVQTDFHYGPTRASVKTNVEYMGSGISVLPSAVSLPATLSEAFTSASSMAISVNGTDYVSTKKVLMGSMGWKNNLNGAMRYTPGSGVDSDGFAVGNRIFIGDREPSFSFTAFLQSGSTEYASLVAQSVGTATVTLTFSSTEFITFNYPSTSFQSVTRGTESGLVAVTCTMAPRYDPTLTGGVPNNVLYVTGKCGLTDIAQ